MKQHTKHNAELFWPRLVMRKWLNLSSKESDYSADSDDDADSDAEEELARSSKKPSRFRDNGGEDAEFDPNDNSDAFPRLRRRNSETFRAQYINNKEIRICVGTWNVGGKLPPDDIDIDDWLDTDEPADIYVLGLQEIVPLSAGNIFGSEDRGPAVKWENTIRETLNRIQPMKSKIKSFSDPPSPSKFKPFEDIPNIEEEILLESDSESGEELYDIGEEIHPLNEESKDIPEDQDQTLASENANMNFGTPDLIDHVMVDMEAEHNLKRQVSSPKRLERLNCLRTNDCSEETEESVAQPNVKLTKMHSSSERVSLSWPEPPLDVLSQHALDKQNCFRQNKSFKGSKSFRTYKSFKTCSSFKLSANDMPSEIALLADIDLEALMKRKRRSQYVRIVSKQMVGVFLTIWVRRSFRRHIQNLKVSTVGVGIMGYIGNKGSISVSMSIYQTPFCFICTHLTSGEKSGDELKRNADVHEIHRRTHFHSLSGIGLPRNIHDHERIIWLGDLNYRINLPFEQTRELIFKKEWSKLVESDQLVREFKKGRAFDGWSEGTLNFPPTYKYEINSEKYFGEDPKAGRRNPAWCDRILSYGNGFRQLRYRRSELKFSDHRPVTATYMAEVEVFSSRKLQRALTFTDAEVENEGVLTNMSAEVGMSHLKIEQDFCVWGR